MNTIDTKLLLKVTMATENETPEYKWVHLCYVDTEIYEKFLNQLKTPGEQLNQTLSKWCNKDFNADIPMETLEDLNTLRNLIKEKYKNIYPEIYRDSETDRQGWTRVWVTKKMMEALNGE